MKYFVTHYHTFPRQQQRQKKNSGIKSRANKQCQESIEDAAYFQFE